MLQTKDSPSDAAIIGAHGRRAFIFVEDGDRAESRFAFSLNGEPVRAAHVIAHRKEFSRGLNLVANGRFDDPVIPWRAVGDTAPIFGRNLSPQWTLSGGNTAYLCAPAQRQARIEYVDTDGDALIPVVPNERYAFGGFFALHRCAGSIRIELFDGNKTLVFAESREIKRKRGGSSLADYAPADIEFLVPATCQYARLQLSIDQYFASQEFADAKACLFFTHIRLAIAGKSDIPGRPENFSSEHAVALSRGGAILDVTLPHLPSGSIVPTSTFEVIDTRTGRQARHSPFVLSPSKEIAFDVSGFDGVTLTGALTGVTAKTSVELVVDGAVIEQRYVGPKAANDSHAVSFRIADNFLDGAPHILELRDETGNTLFINAVTLRSIVTPWEIPDDTGHFQVPIEFHPLARQRYQSLLATLDGHTRHHVPDHGPGNRLRQLALCHDILAGKLGIGDNPGILEFPENDSPDVSVILHTSDVRSFYGTAAAILLAHNDAAYEVIVSTDDSTENISAAEKFITGVRFVACKPGTGRAELINKGAQSANGKYIALLAISAEPGAYWIDELVQAFNLFNKVGMAGSKLIKPNGRLHEAGGVLWSSGNWSPVGANANAQHPQVNYARQVDYLSGNALLVPRDIWQAVGGLSYDLFDATLEDIDLAIKVRTAGHKVVYAPYSVVTIEPETSQVPARPVSPEFKRRWADVLKQLPAETIAVQRMLDRGSKDRILFIDQRLPRGDVDAGSYAAIQEMRLFQALGYKVTFLPLNLTYADAYAKALGRMGVELIHAPFALSVEEVIKERGAEFSLVYVTRYQVARAVMPFVRRFNRGAKIIFNNADLHFLRELRSALAIKDPELLRRSKLTRDHELEVMRQADLTLSYNDVEHAVIQSHNFDETKVAKAPWVVKASDSIAPFEKRRDIGFIGSFGHRPNVDAINFFAAEVIPLLRQKLPNIRLIVFGSQITSEVKARANEHVIVRGHVSDVAEAFDTLRLFVAPLTAGAGIKGKVLSAMAHGVPTVLSPAAAEGINAQAGIHYLSARIPEEWVSAISAIYDDAKQWNAMSQLSLGFVRTNHSFERGVETMRAALEMINIFPPRNPEALWCRAILPPL